MKANQVNKLYSKLTPNEQAALVIEAASRLDESGIDAIVAQVERKHYLSVHADYTRRIHGLTWLIGQYGIEYWKCRTLMVLACDSAENNEQQAEQFANQYFNKTIALELALVDVCKQMGVDVGAIKKMAGCLPDEFKGHDLPEVDSELIKRYADMFDGLVSL